MSIQYLVYGGGGALLGGILGMLVGGPVGAASLASAGCALGLNIRSTEATDRLKEKTVNNLTGLVGEISRKWSDSLLGTVDHAIKTTSNSVAQSLQSLTNQSCYTINTIGNMLISGIVGGGLYWIVSSDLSSRCTAFPAGCSVLTLSGITLLMATTIGISYNFYCVSSGLKVTQQKQPVHQVIHALPLQEGLSLIGKCNNAACDFFDKKVIYSAKFGKFDVGQLFSRVVCGNCTKSIPISTINEMIAKNCRLSYEGWDKKGIQRKKDPTLVSKEQISTEWQYLEISTEAVAL